MHEHSENIKLPCEHECCKKCLFECLENKEIFKCEECNFDTSQLPKYIKLENSSACYIMARSYKFLKIGDKSECIKLYLTALKDENHDKNILNNIGKLYLFSSDIKSLDYFNKSIQKYENTKNIDILYYSCYNIGVIYSYKSHSDQFDERTDVKKNYKKAIEYYEKAIKYYENLKNINNLYNDLLLYGQWDYSDHNGIYKRILNNVANIYYEGGYGIDKDYKKAIEYYEKVNDSIKIADIYYEGGYGIEKNYKKSLECYEENNEYIRIADIYYEGGYGIEKNYEKAFEIYEFELNDSIDYNYHLDTVAYLYYKTSKVYFHGYKKSKSNYKKAVEYCENAIEYYKKTQQPDAKNSYCSYYLLDLKQIYNDIGFYYWCGDEYLDRDYKTAIEYFKLGKEYNILGSIYYKGGYGITQDYLESYKYYELSNNIYMMGMIQLNVRNYIKSVELLKTIKEDNNDYLKSQLLLGHIYSMGGYGVLKDYVESINYYKKAYWYDPTGISKKKLYELYIKIGNIEKSIEYK